MDGAASHQCNQVAPKQHFDAAYATVQAAFDRSLVGMDLEDFETLRRPESNATAVLVERATQQLLLLLLLSSRSLLFFFIRVSVVAVNVVVRHGGR